MSLGVGHGRLPLEDPAEVDRVGPQRVQLPGHAVAEGERALEEVAAEHRQRAVLHAGGQLARAAPRQGEQHDLPARAHQRA